MRREHRKFSSRVSFEELSDPRLRVDSFSKSLQIGELGIDTRSIQFPAKIFENFQRVRDHYIRIAEIAEKKLLVCQKSDKSFDFRTENVHQEKPEGFGRIRGHIHLRNRIGNFVAGREDL